MWPLVLALVSSVLTQQEFLGLSHSHQVATTEWYTTNSSQQSSRTVIITVTENGLTHTVRQRDSIQALLGSHLIIACVDSDTRYTEVTWYNEEVNITATSLVPESILQLSPVRRSDNGEVTCVTNTTQGDSHWRTVMIKPMSSSRHTFLNHDRAEDLTFFIVVSGFLGAIIVIAFVGFTGKYIRRQYRLGRYDEEKWYLKLVFLGKVPLHPCTPLSDAVVLIERDPAEDRIMLPINDTDELDGASWHSDHSDDEYPGNIMLPSDI